MNITIDLHTGEIITDTPMYLRDNGIELLNKRQKELEIYLKLLETYPQNLYILKEKTLIYIDGDEYTNWFHERKTKDEFMGFILNPKNHYIDGKKWNNGFLGSRWVDTKINSKNIRIAFYSRKMDDFDCKDKDYCLSIIVK